MILIRLVRMLGLKLKAVKDIEFKGLLMRTANYRDIILDY